MVVVAMLVCSAVYAWLQRPKSPAILHSSAPAQSVTTPAPVTPPAPVQAAPPAAVPPPAPVAVGDQIAADPKAADQKAGEAKPNEPKPAVPNPDATVHVEIRAEDTVWILVRTDGKYAFSGTLAAGESRLVEGVKDVVIRLGNAGGVTITLNGKQVGPVGPKGQPRTVQLTSGGFQIVPAKSPVPLDPLDRL
jgi:cytoskeletal protein RodZ